MKTFDVDFKKLIVLLLPSFLRLKLLFALFFCGVKPVRTLYFSFMTNRKDNLYKANHNGQVCFLRGMLNDIFDPVQRRIYIGIGKPASWLYAWKTATWTVQGSPIWAQKADTVTTQPKTLHFNSSNRGVTLVSKQGSVGASGYDFTVNIPVDLRPTINESKLIAYLNYYKLISKRYIVNYYG